VFPSGISFIGSCPTPTTEHHQAGLGMLVPKPPAGAVLESAFALKSRFWSPRAALVLEMEFVNILKTNSIALVVG
jgi:hypothetical protein